MITNKNFRASTIFPIFFSKDSKNSLNFLSYWKFKNKYDQVLMHLTFRDSEGELIKKEMLEISDDPKSYEIELDKFLDKESFRSHGFDSYVEVEVFFKKEPLLKYPALVYTISNKAYTSSIHSCLRNYNPSEIRPIEATKLNQTGFDIFLKNGIKNYILLAGGEEQDIYRLNLSILSTNNTVLLDKELILKNSCKKKLFEIIINDYIDESLFKDNHYKVIIKHDISDIFPRLYVGNYSKESLPSITHTFFDESGLDLKQTDINLSKEHPSSAFIFPTFNHLGLTSSISSYMANRPWKGFMKARILNSKGNVMDYYDFNSDEVIKFQSISKKYTNEMFNYEKQNKEQLFCKYEFFSDNFPERNKLGLNIGVSDIDNTSTNICFSPTLNNKKLNDKQTHSTWSPIGGKSRFIVYFHNTSLNPKIHNSDLEVIIFSKNGSTNSVKFALEPDESIIFSSEDKSIYNTIGDELGYLFFKTSNPYYSSWYFSLSEFGVGGDHSF